MLVRTTFLVVVMWTVWCHYSLADKRSENDSILDRIIQLTERMDVMAGTVKQVMEHEEKLENNFEQRIGAIDDKMVKLIGSVQDVVDREDKIEKRVESIESSIVPTFAWKFQGYGTYRTQDAEVRFPNTPLSLCKEICWKKHTGDSSWNGISWLPANICFCHQNDEGNDERYPSWLHFKIE